MASPRKLSEPVKPKKPIVDPGKEFLKTVNSMQMKYGIGRVFDDFCHMSLCALHNGFAHVDQLESEYLDIAGKYDSDEMVKMSHLLSYVVLALEGDPNKDFLGRMFAVLELADANQAFTPPSVATMMAKMTLGETVPKGREFVTVSDPACGSGNMVIAAAAVVRNDWQENVVRFLFAEAVDINRTCVAMAYVQLTLLGIPARVVLGNTLKMEHSRCYYTPAYWLGNWEYRLKHSDGMRRPRKLSAPRPRR